MKDLYIQLCNKKSDINEHLSVLKKYSEKCNRVTEFGVRRGTSTCALLMGKPKIMKSFDIEKKDKLPLKKYEKFAKENGIDFKFYVKNVLDIKIDETDLLFIDTLHTYSQLYQELYLHGNKAQKFIIFHDTVTYGEIGENGLKPGLMKAIKEFMKNNPEWKMKENLKNNNGLVIIDRK